MGPEREHARKLILPLGLLAAALLGFFAWSQYSARMEAERTLGLSASRIVSAHFSDAAALKVGGLQGQVLARGEDKGFLGLIPSEQVMKVPYSVDYFLDVSKLGSGSYRWDAKKSTLTIDVPDVVPGAPNIDEARSQSQQRGWFISRGAALNLARLASQRAAAQSRVEAAKPEHLNPARENARKVLAAMAIGPLRAAGLNDVRVAVSFPWEPKGGGTRLEQWDVSRSVEDVLKERKHVAAP
jgi:hypothetical protein